MENTEYGIFMRTLADNEDGTPFYTRWDSIKGPWLDKPNVRKAFEYVSDGLVIMGLRAEFSTDSQVSSEETTWHTRVSLSGYGGTLMCSTSEYATVEEADYCALAVLRTWIEGITAKKFLGEITPRAAAVGLVLESKCLGNLDSANDAEYIREIVVHYGNNTSASKASSSESANSKIMTISLSDPLWLKKIMDMVTFHEARIELAKFSLEFPDLVLQFSPDGRSFKVPYLYRRDFVQIQIDRELTGDARCRNEDEISGIVRELDYIPITKTNLRDLSKTIRRARGTKSALNDIPEDTAG